MAERPGGPRDHNREPRLRYLSSGGDVQAVEATDHPEGTLWGPGNVGREEGWRQSSGGLKASAV
jgi:hypothetical protein